MAGAASASLEFTARTMEGGVVRGADLLDGRRPVLFVFLVPSCPPCRDLLPSVVRWARSFEDQLRVVTVTSRVDEALRQVVGGHEGSIVVDADLSAHKALGARGTPSAVLVSAGGAVAADVATTDREIRHLLASALTPTRLTSNDSDERAAGPAVTVGPDAVLRAVATVTEAATGPDSTGVVLVDEATEASVSLDALGALVWTTFDGQHSVREIARELAGAFHVPAQRVEADVLELARTLVSVGLVTAAYDESLPLGRRA